MNNVSSLFQSLKMLVMDWCRSGRVIFCDVKPAVKEQLSHVLQDAIYCDTDQLRTCLASK